MNGEDQDLLRRMLAGEEDAFTALYRRQQGGVYRFALHMSGSTAIAFGAAELASQAADSRADEGVQLQHMRG